MALPSSMGRIYAATQPAENTSRSSKSFLEENSEVLSHISELAEMQATDLESMSTAISKLAVLTSTVMAGKTNVRLGNFSNSGALDKVLNNLLIKVRNQANHLARHDIEPQTMGEGALLNTLNDRLDEIKENIDELLEDKLATILKDVIAKTTANAPREESAKILEQLGQITEGRSTEMLSGEASPEALEKLLAQLKESIPAEDTDSAQKIDEILATLKDPEEGPNKELGDFIKELRNAETLSGKSLDEILSQLAGGQDSPILPEIKEVLEGIEVRDVKDSETLEGMGENVSQIETTSTETKEILQAFENQQEEYNVLEAYRLQKLIKKIEQLTNSVSELTDSVQNNGADVLNNLSAIQENSTACGCPIDEGGEPDNDDDNDRRRRRKKPKRRNRRRPPRSGRGRGRPPRGGGGRPPPPTGGGPRGGGGGAAARAVGTVARFAVARALPVAAAFAGGWYVGTKIHERFGDQIQKGVEFAFGDPEENARKKLEKERRGRIYKNQDILPEEIKKKGTDPSIEYIKKVLIPETQAQTDISERAKMERLRQLNELRSDLFQEYKETDYVKDISDIKIRIKAMDEKKVPTLEELKKTYRGISEESYAKIVASLPPEFKRNAETGVAPKKDQEADKSKSAKVPAITSTAPEAKENKQADALKQADSSNSFRSMINSAMFASPLLRNLSSRIFQLPTAVSNTFGNRHTPQTEQFSKVLENYGPVRQFIRNDGAIETRKGGSRAWRNNNPGNLRYTDFSKRNGAIGIDSGGFAIFPSREIGEAAQINLLKSNYNKLTLKQMIYKYAPPSENNTEQYLAQVVMRTGIGPQEIVGTLDANRFKSLVSEVQKHEGWIEGTSKVDKSTANANAGGQAFIPYRNKEEAAASAKSSGGGGAFSGAGASGSWGAPAASTTASNANAVPAQTNNKKQNLESSDIKIPMTGGNTKYKDLKVKSGESIGGGNAHQGILELAKVIQGNYGIRHFSAFNDRYHRNKRPNSLHTKGLALDFSLKAPNTAAKVTASIRGLLKKSGVNAKVLNEYANPSAGATGGHIHVQFQSRGDADNFLKQVRNTQQNKKANGGVPELLKRPAPKQQANVPARAAQPQKDKGKAPAAAKNNAAPPAKQPPVAPPPNFQKSLEKMQGTLNNMAKMQAAGGQAQSVKTDGFWPTQSARDSAIRDMQDAKFTSGSGLIDT